MKKRLLIICTLLLSTFYVMAQNNVKGIVYDAQSKEPLIGVSVMIKGTQRGTATDHQGEFQINVSPSEALIFKYVGYKEQEVSPGNRTNLTVNLEQDAVLLQEAVVTTALGMKQDARAVGYAISTVKGEELVKTGVTVNPLTALYGKAAGVGVQATAAGPMGGTKINIRGATGLESTSNTRPLFVVDGVPMYDSDSNMASRGYDPLNSFDYGTAINDLNVEDIESIDILKGAKAAVLYGGQGANGVVLISTKKGAGTRGLGINLSYGFEIEKPYSLVDWQNEYGTGRDEYSISESADGVRRTVSDRYSFGPKFDGSDILWFDGTTRKYQAYKDNDLAMYDDGKNSTFNAAISGGNDQGNMRLSFGHNDYDGTLPNQYQIKNTLSFNGQMQVSKLAKIEVMQYLTNTKSHNRTPNNQRMVSYNAYNRDYDMKSALNSYKDENGYRVALKDLTTITEDGWGWPSAFAGDEDGVFSMLWRMNEQSNMDKRVNSTTSIITTLQFLPTIGLRLKGAMNNTETDYVSKYPVEGYNEDLGTYEKGRFTSQVERNRIQEYEAMLTFNDDFVDDQLNVTAFAGTSYKKQNYDYHYLGTGSVSQSQLTYPDWYHIKNAAKWPTQFDTSYLDYKTANDVTYSVLGQAQLSWNYEFIAEFSARNDWSSTLPEKNRSYFYPGAAVIWNFTERYKDLGPINYGKLRLNWGDTGRSASRYFALNSYEMNALASPNTDKNDVTGPTSLMAKELKPERKRELEAGFNIHLFPQKRLEVDFSFYQLNFYNQIMKLTIDSSTGVNNAKINAGEIRNRGLELFLKGAIIKQDNFQWDMTLNIDKRWNSIEKLYDGIHSYDKQDYGVILKSTVGEGNSMLWMQDYVKDENGNRVVSATGFYQMSEDAENQICVGSVLPDMTGGVSTNFYFSGSNWGMLNLYADLDFRRGGKVMSYSNFYLKAYGLTKETLKYRDEDRGGLAYYIEGDAAGGKKIAWEHDKAAPDNAYQGRVYHDGMILKGVNAEGEQNDVIISAFQYHQSFVHDSSTGWQPDMFYDNHYIKLRTIALTYTVPAKISNRLNLQKLSLTLTARNLGYLYKSIPNIDAEATLGTGSDQDWREYSINPSTRAYGFKVNVSF